MECDFCGSETDNDRDDNGQCVCDRCLRSLAVVPSIEWTTPPGWERLSLAEQMALIDAQDGRTL